jgi:uncharacterized protein
MKAEDKFANPYLAAIALGLVMLAAFLIMGNGLGASGAASRMGVAGVDTIASDHVDQNPYMARTKADNRSPLDNWFVFEILGVFLGGAVSAYAAGRLKKRVVRGPNIGVRSRLILAFSGGILMGIAARLGRGCTSGQALSGGALMSVGSWIFMLAIFAGGYAFAYFVRRQWT